jgi:hypothetical protein
MRGMRYCDAADRGGCVSPLHAQGLFQKTVVCVVCTDGCQGEVSGQLEDRDVRQVPRFYRFSTARCLLHLYLYLPSGVPPVKCVDGQKCDIPGFLTPETSVCSAFQRFSLHSTKRNGPPSTNETLHDALLDLGLIRHMAPTEHSVRSGMGVLTERGMSAPSRLRFRSARCSRILFTIKRLPQVLCALPRRAGTILGSGKEPGGHPARAARARHPPNQGRHPSDAHNHATRFQRKEVIGAAPLRQLQPFEAKPHDGQTEHGHKERVENDQRHISADSNA